MMSFMSWLLQASAVVGAGMANKNAAEAGYLFIFLSLSFLGSLHVYEV